MFYLLKKQVICELACAVENGSCGGLEWRELYDPSELTSNPSPKTLRKSRLAELQKIQDSLK